MTTLQYINDLENIECDCTAREDVPRIIRFESFKDRIDNQDVTFDAPSSIDVELILNKFPHSNHWYGRLRVPAYKFKNSRGDLVYHPDCPSHFDIILLRKVNMGREIGDWAGYSTGDWTERFNDVKTLICSAAKVCLQRIRQPFKLYIAGNYPIPLLRVEYDEKLVVEFAHNLWLPPVINQLYS